MGREGGVREVQACGRADIQASITWQCSNSEVSVERAKTVQVDD